MVGFTQTSHSRRSMATRAQAQRSESRNYMYLLMTCFYVPQARVYGIRAHASVALLFCSSVGH